MLAGSVRTTVSRWLEEGTFSGVCARAVSRAHAPFATRAVARPLVVPAGLATVTIGGATLGGSGKTRVALACVRELEARGVAVVLVGHGYGSRASTRAAQLVSAHSVLADVGDEALACARALAGTRARVVVGASRQAAIDFVAQLAPRADVVVIDGPLQLAPSRAWLSILALDAAAPWGAGDVAPSGDLRAPRAALLAHADHVVSVDARPSAVVIDGHAIDLASFAASHAHARIGLFTAIARPRRLVNALHRARVEPTVVVSAPDHGPVTVALARKIAASEVDLWLATQKCVLRLETANLMTQLAILEGDLTLPAPVSDALAMAGRS